jgi:hypothetical protein
VTVVWPESSDMAITLPTLLQEFAVDNLFRLDLEGVA